MHRIPRLLALAVIVGTVGLGYWIVRQTMVPSTTDDGPEPKESFAAQFHVEVLGAGPTISQDIVGYLPDFLGHPPDFLISEKTWPLLVNGKQHFCQPGLPIDLRVTLENPGERALRVHDPFWLTGFDRVHGGSFAWTSLRVREPVRGSVSVSLGATIEHSVYGNSNHPQLTEFGRRQSAPTFQQEIAPGGARQWVLPLSRVYDLSQEGLSCSTLHGIVPTFADAIPAGNFYVWSLTTASDPQQAAEKEAAEAAERQRNPRRLGEKTNATDKRPEPLDASQTEIDDAGVAWGRAVAGWRLGIGLDGELSDHLNGPVRLRILLKNTSEAARTISVGPPLTLERFRFHSYLNGETIAPLTQHGNLELAQQQFDDVELETVTAGAVLERRFFLSRHFDLSLYPNFDVQMVRLLPQPDGTMARLLSGVLNVKRYVYRGPKGPKP